MGYQACVQASDAPVPQGSVGAGTGATVGKILGMEYATKGGLGSASMIVGDVVIGALVVVNPFGDVRDPRNGQIIAGPRVTSAQSKATSDAAVFRDTLALMKRNAGVSSQLLSNTVVGVVATNARLTKEEANKVAQMAQDGLARTIFPAHTMFDGDTIFALSTGSQACDVSTVGACAAEVVADAVVRAVYEAKKLAEIPAYRDIVSATGV
ncbi:MAG: hypothetical protein D6755_06500 [Anaerolineae bacterium]|nr:MAG: hypothetical protein D6755_06500 [Anaerolineae bacterium]